MGIVHLFAFATMIFSLQADLEVAGTTARIVGDVVDGVTDAPESDDNPDPTFFREWFCSESGFYWERYITRARWRAVGRIIGLTCAIHGTPPSNAERLAQLYCRRAATHDRLGDLDHAIEDYSLAMRFDPKSVGARLGRGAGYLAMGEKEWGKMISDEGEAWGSLEHFLFGVDVLEVPGDDHYTVVVPADWRMRELRRGLQYFGHRIASNYLAMPLADATGHLDLAARDFREAVRLSPNDPKTRMQSLGLCARADIARGAVSKAIGDCSAMIKISPDRWVFALRAGVYRAQGNRDAAIADLTQTIRVAPEASDCNFERGEILAQDGQLACVMSDLAEVIRIDLQLPDDEFYYDRRVRLGDAPRMDESHFARGEMLAQSGQLDRAIADFTRAIEIDEGWRVHHGNLRPILILAHQRRGEIYRMRGEQALAKKDFAAAKMEKAIGVGRAF